ncbi:LacI family transcriptional regulator [Chromatiales bacterium (ex Bugula neritina AB1)]|nr:LacI family transcriptional regulator [Chromatiales bacterium (ex Bugula neritina AB1)]
MSQPKIKNMEAFAAACGISRPTISKYFHDPGSVRKSTRERIEAALDQYDYRPNIFAMDQNRRKTKNVGIVVPYLADPVFGEIARNLERRCLEAGFRATLLSAHGEQALEIEAFERLKALRPAGVLLAPLGRLSNLDALSQFCDEVPTVLFDRNIAGVGQAFVGSDNESFVSQSTEYLVRTGEPPCFFEMKSPSNPNSIARRRSYKSSMEALGLDPMTIRIEGKGWNLEEIGYNGALRILQKGSLPTNTVLCSNDRLAIGFLAACHEKGLRIGRHKGCAMRVAAHDNHPFSRFTCPPLTTVGHDYDVVSNFGVECLFDLIEKGGQFEQRTETVFPAQLVLRESA